MFYRQKFFCWFVNRITKTLWTDLDDFFRIGQRTNEQLIDELSWSRIFSSSWSARSVSTFVTPKIMKRMFTLCGGLLFKSSSFFICFSCLDFSLFFFFHYFISTTKWHKVEYRWNLLGGMQITAEHKFIAVHLFRQWEKCRLKIPTPKWSNHNLVSNSMQCNTV